MANDTSWLIQPVAHRGLHDESLGIIENTATAVEAAISAGYAVEVDVQPSGDGTAMVFHDPTLERLTHGVGEVASRNAADLKRLRFRATNDRMQTLAELLSQVAGRAPLFIEIKSDWGPRGPFERHVAETLSAYGGKVAVMSFDPNVVAAFAEAAPERTRGLVAGSFRTLFYWGHLPAWRRFFLRHLLSAFIAKPHFVAYDIEALPAPAPWFWRNVLRRPLLTWAVRDEAQRRKGARWADAVIFEGVRP